MLQNACLLYTSNMDRDNKREITISISESIYEELQGAAKQLSGWEREQLQGCLLYTSSYTISKLKKGKIYYVRIRAYKMDSTGKKV